jgi:ribosomal protein L29
MDALRREKSLRAIAAELTRMRIQTARGGVEWSTQQVSNMLWKRMVRRGQQGIFSRV